MQIKFFFKDTSIKIPERKKLKQFVANLFSLEATNLTSLDYVFCTDEYLLAINKEFLNHDDFTDIITFVFSGKTEPVVGEIYISIDRVIENSKKFKVDRRRELYRVIFHGALHLCGYKDKSTRDKKDMTAAEDKYLDMYNK